MSKTKLTRPRRSSRTGSGIITVIALILVVVIVAAAGIILVPRLTHHCDNCGQFFFGTGYYANIITNTLTDLAGTDNKILCLDCAVTEHALAIATGSSIKDFERPLFEFLETQPTKEGE